MNESNVLARTQISNRNVSIDVFRYICAVFVVAIHTNPFSDINYTLSFIVNDIIVRIAVPFFLVTMGYYYIGSLLANRKIFLKTIKKLATVYVIWSIPYLTYDLVNYIRNDMSLVSWMKKTLVGFFITGSWEHLWFIPASIITIIIVTVFHKINGLKALVIISIPLYVFGTIGVSFAKAFVDLPILYSYFNGQYFTPTRRIFFMALPFFMIGYFLQKIVKSKRFSSFGINKYNIILLIFGVINVCEIILVEKLNFSTGNSLNFALYPFMLILMLVLIKDPFRKLSRVSTTLRDLSGFTYYSHVLFIIVIGIVLYVIKANYTISSTPMFILVILLTASTGLLLIKIDNKYLNMLYK